MFKIQCRNCGAIQSDSSATKTVCEVCTIDASFLQTIITNDDETTTNNSNLDEQEKIQCRNCSEWIATHHQSCPHCAYINKSLTVKNTNKKNNSFILLN